MACRRLAAVCEVVPSALGYEEALGWAIHGCTSRILLLRHIALRVIGASKL
jgi:hypothetical protein